MLHPDCQNDRVQRCGSAPDAGCAPREGTREDEYRSRIRPALAVNCRSRGKIHERCCQGLIASSKSQRQTVTPEICSQIPRSEKVATWRLWAVFRTITAIDPSLLRNAVTSSRASLVVVPMRTAPGRMNRL
jgi:hypothetical protein